MELYMSLESSEWNSAYDMHCKAIAVQRCSLSYDSEL